LEGFKPFAVLQYKGIFEDRGRYRSILRNLQTDIRQEKLMRPISSITAVCVSLAFLIPAGAQDNATTRDLSVEQVTVHNAGTEKGSLRITASVDRKDLTYARGETVKLNIKTNEDAYVTIYSVGPSGQVTQLFPNKFQQNNLVKANKATDIPDGKSQIRVSGPVGAELIKIIASNKPHHVLPVTSLESGQVFVVMKGGVAELVRNLEVAAVPAADKLTMHNLIIKTIASR
jgi:Domain of unknown function (DUF4384)